MATRVIVVALTLFALGCGARAERAEEAQAPDSAPDLRTRKVGDDWLAFLGPLGTSVSREKGLSTPWPARGPRLLWHKSVGIGYGMPAIQRGRLFHFDRVRNSARLLCLKSETGEFLWKFDYPTDYVDQYGYDSGPRCCPVVDEDRVYIFGAEGMLHCLRTTDGSLLWKVDTKRDFGVVQNFFGVGSAPVIEGDLLLVQVGGSPPGSDQVPFEELKSNGSALVAFDKTTGKVRYRAGNDLASYAVPVVASVNGQRRCFLLARSGLLALDPANGKVDFHFPWRASLLESVNASNPLVIGDRVLISETYGPGSALLRLTSGGPEVVWSDARKRAGDKSLQCHWMTPIHHEGYVYGSSGRHEGNAELRCVELATGKVRWSEPGLTRTSLLLVDGHLICLGERGELRLLKATPERYTEVSNTLIRDFTQGDDPPSLLRAPCWAAPILSHGLLYLRGEGRLVCLEVIPQPGTPSQ